MEEGAPSLTPAGVRAVATLARDLADVLVEFSIVLHKRAMYPLGHPHLQESTARFVERLDSTAGHAIPLLEAYGVVRSLSLAMHGSQEIVLPLLALKEFDRYTTTHSMNVSVLAMALGEFLGCAPAAVRGFGPAGLLHDLGKVRIPREILSKPGRLTAAERAVVEAHPADGARLILQGQEALDLAAVLAYEHHRYHDGGRYPRVHYPRAAHQASSLVHVCDVYDALRTRRPYRDAWSSHEALAYIESRAGSEFDPAMASAFIAMMSRRDGRVSQEDVA